MISKKLLQVLTWPIRVLFKPFRRSAGAAARDSGGTAGRTAAGAAARLGPGAILEEEYREEPPRGIEAAMFRQLPRPRLTEKSASELTLEQARKYAAQAERFYDFEFPLFPRGDFFYEEIEKDFLYKALGYTEGSIDQRFIDVANLFRRALNDNTRGLMLFWTPLVGALVLGAAAAALSYQTVVVEPWVLYGAASVMAALLAFLVYSWPYKVVQQRNLLNLDNYVTSKFARINNNFQVAKRRALNVERDKRIPEREELMDEAGAWTLSYHWFAMRLFLCESMLRNKFYQIRRNTALYWAGGVFLMLIVASCVIGTLWVSGVDRGTIGIIAAASGVYVFVAGATMARATSTIFNVVQSNEWSRFSMINLDRTIRDHVAEDKLQIVTFRDRNRME